MRSACDDILGFTDEPARKFTAEYLLTVNVAKAISDLNGPPGDPYKIFIEKDAVHFAQDCLRPVRFGHPQKQRRLIRRSRIPPKIVRPGRIDIVVYSDGKNGYLGPQPVCAIEVKGFNPARTLVLEDLRRNLQFLRVEGATGRSELAFTVLAALHAYRRHRTDTHIERNEERAKKLHQRWMAQLGNIEDVHTTIETFTVRKEKVGRVLDEGEYTVLDAEAAHHFVGAIVCFFSKAACASHSHAYSGLQMHQRPPQPEPSSV